MSVEQLKFEVNDDDVKSTLFVNNEEELLIMQIRNEENNKIDNSVIVLDRSQAHLLMLYLQEHMEELK